MQEKVEEGKREKGRGKKRKEKREKRKREKGKERKKEKREKRKEKREKEKKEKGKRKKEIQANDPEIFLKNEFVEVELMWQHKVNKIFASRNCWIDRTAVMDEESLLQCIRSLYR